MVLENSALKVQEREALEIRFSCPACGAHLLADWADAGAQADCPKCAAIVVIPGDSPDPPTSQEKQYYLYKDGKQLGPYPLSHITVMLAQNRLSRTDWAWTQGMAEWQPLCTLKEIVLPSPQPPPSPLAAPGSFPAKPAPAPSPSSSFSLGDIAPLFQKADDPFNSAIDSLAVSESWKEVFRLIEDAGGFNGIYARNSGVLSFRERFKIMFNIWGFLFGPFYYFAKGMWVKGTIFLGLAIAFASLKILYGFHFAHYLLIPLPFLTANLANGDYYLWKVEKKQLW